MTLARLESSKNGVDRVHNERVARGCKNAFSPLLQHGKADDGNASKTRKVTCDTGPLPGFYLWNDGSDRHGINTSVERIDWAGELGVIW